MELKDWALAPSSQLASGGDGQHISQPGYNTSGWLSITAPATVLAGLVQAGEVVDPFFGVNLQDIGTAPFETPWWYRAEFTFPTPATGTATSARITFKGKFAARVV